MHKGRASLFTGCSSKPAAQTGINKEKSPTNHLPQGSGNGAARAGRLKRSGAGRRASCVNGNTRFLGLSVVFGESVRVSAWPLIASPERRSEENAGGGGGGARPAVGFCRLATEDRITRKTREKNPEELQERASVQPCAESNPTVLLCSVVQAKHS